MRPHRRYLFVATLTVATLLGTLVACSNDHDDSTATPAPTGPTASPLPTQTANDAALSAAEAFLEGEGVDGETGEFTNPLNCSDSNEDSPGRFCVHDAFTTYAPGLVIVRFGDKENPDDSVWEVRLEPDGEEWQVTSAGPFQLSE